MGGWITCCHKIFEKRKKEGKKGKNKEIKKMWSNLWVIF
jgi:hypothetical protein